jgi:hypothetical protein
MSEEIDLTADGGEPDDSEYALVYPFVCCISNGGPYDDAAFVAGARFGQICAELKAKPAIYDTTVEPALIPQLDLLAMHSDYTMVHEEAIADAWEYVTFRLADAGGHEAREENTG